MHTKIRLAVEGLYIAFHRPTPITIDGCECCLERIDIHALVHTPLRHLTYPQLSDYAVDAIYTVGSADDFRYFLPRLIELAFAEPPYVVSPEPLLGRLRHANWRSWPIDEQRAIEALADAVGQWLGDAPLDPSDIDSWICALGQIFDDVTPRLGCLLADMPAARHNLYGFYDWNRRDVEKRETLDNAFWINAAEEVNPNVAHINAWLRRSDVSAAIDRAYAAEAAPLE